MKTKFILGFLFIMIILVSLHNKHVLNYTKNILKKIAYQTPKNILKVVTKHWKMKQFSRNTLWKMNNFLENINTETNKVKTLRSVVIFSF